MFITTLHMRKVHNQYNSKNIVLFKWVIKWEWVEGGNVQIFRNKNFSNQTVSRFLMGERLNDEYITSRSNEIPREGFYSDQTKRAIEYDCKINFGDDYGDQLKLR